MSFSGSNSDDENSYYEGESSTSIINIIEEINSSLNNLKINCNTVEMAHAQVPQAVAVPPVFKTEYLQMVPEFTGDQNNLNDFIKNCEEIITQFYQPNVDNFQNKYILNCLKNKIQGKAKNDISTYTVENWATLRAALLATYADKRDLQTLTIELCQLYQNKLTPIEFFNKIQSNLNLQIAYCNTYFNNAKATHSIENALAIGLRIFLKNLNQPLGDYVTTRNPNSLQEALNILVNDFQINDKIRTTTNSSHVINNKPQTHFSKQQFNKIVPSNMAPRNVNPIQFQRPNNVDVFKPKPNYQHQNKPTPMSISTHNTVPQSRYFKQPYQSFRRPQNYIAEELHNVDEPSPCYSVSQQENCVINETDYDDYDEHDNDHFLDVMVPENQVT